MEGEGKAVIQNVEKLLEVRIVSAAPGIATRQFKLFRGDASKGKVDYALFIDDRYFGVFDASNDQEGAFAGMAKIRSLMSVPEDEMTMMLDAMQPDEEQERGNE